MKTATSVYAGIAVIATISVVSLGVALRNERMAGAVEQAQPSEPQRPVSLPPDSGASAPLAVVAPPAETPINSTGPSASLASRMAVIGMVPNPAEHLKERLKDPEYRKTLLAHMRADIGRLYPGLVEELGLSEIEAGKLFDLLADSQLARAEDGYILGGQVDPQEARYKQEEFDRILDEAIQAQFGGKYAQWQTYRQTRSARSQVTAMVTQLAQAGRPLTEAQNRAVTTSLIDEQQRQEQEARSLPRTPPGNPEDPAYRARMMEELSSRTEENNRRTLDAVARHIDADQLAVLRNQLERQTGLIR